MYIKGTNQETKKVCLNNAPKRVARFYGKQSYVTSKIRDIKS